MSRRLALRLLILATSTVWALVSCASPPSQTVDVKTQADQQSFSTWQDAWRQPIVGSSRGDIQTVSAQFDDTTGEIEYQAPTGTRQVQIKDISHSPNECSAWNISATDSSAGVEWRGLCNITYSARSQEAASSAPTNTWSSWATGKDEVVCELVNNKWSCAVGRGSMQSFVPGTD